MNLKCLFGHQWNGCKCERCGAIKKKVVSESLNELIRLYSSSPKGEGFITDSYAAEPVRKIGKELNAAGGFQLMLSVHNQFAATYNVRGTARNLEMVWDGIGSWRG